MSQIQPLFQHQWTRRLLVVAMSAAMSSQVLALEAISDEDMSAATGEGIAFLPENASIRMNGADTNNSGAGTFDTGYIRIIPVGPLTTAAAASGAGKGDIFLYGLAVSQSDKAYGAGRASTDWNNRFSRTIDSWGMPENPWVLKVETVTGVPDFAAPDPTATTNGSVSYLGLEAPLYRTGNIVALSDAEKSAYNLKLAFWADAFVRDPSVVEGLPGQFDLGGSGRANRLRLQAIWDGFSINGSDVKIFQTLGGAQTGVQGMSSSYNNTLGIAGKLRFNSGDSSSLRATTSFTAGSRTVEAYTVTWDGATFRNVAGPSNYTNTSGVAGGAASPACTNTAVNRADGSSCRMQFRTRATIDTASSSTWTAPALNSVFRISTRETTNTGLLSTPAINGGNAPVFDDAEGLFLYNLNVNLVLGSLYQPLTVGVAPDGKNIVLELARIPNKESIYKQVYTNYANGDSATNGGYFGSTCNVHQCGATRTLGGVTYQGNTATHSSITIGSTEYNAGTNSLTAHKGIGAIGISFGALPTNTQTVSTAAQSYRDVQTRNRGTTGALGTFPAGAETGWTNLAVGQSARYNLAAFSPTTWTQQAPLAEPAFATPMSSVPINNLGSAVIDGLLIQHLKFSTKGL